MFKRFFKALNIFKRIKEVEKKVEELSKRTISQRTLRDEDRASVNQIINEWLNGEDKEDKDGK